MAFWRSLGSVARTASWNSADVGGLAQPAQLEPIRPATARAFRPVSARSIPGHSLSIASGGAGSALKASILGLEGPELGEGRGPPFRPGLRPGRPRLPAGHAGVAALAEPALALGVGHAHGGYCSRYVTAIS